MGAMGGPAAGDTKLAGVHRAGGNHRETHDRRPEDVLNGRACA